MHPSRGRSPRHTADCPKRPTARSFVLGKLFARRKFGPIARGTGQPPLTDETVLLRRPPTIDRNSGARDVVRLRGTQPNCQPRDLNGRREAPRGLLFGQHRLDRLFSGHTQLLTTFGDLGRHERRVHPARADAVNRHAAGRGAADRGVFERCDFRQPNESELGGNKATCLRRRRDHAPRRC